MFVSIKKTFKFDLECIALYAHCLLFVLLAIIKYFPV